MQLYSYFRSSASYRVRIALAWKRLDHDYLPVHLPRNEHHARGFAELTPHQQVPVLQDGDQVLTQSLAIIEYLEETHPMPPLLPADAAGRARVRALALNVACDIHPPANLRVLRYLLHDLNVGEERKDQWCLHWVQQGLQAMERQLARHPATGRYCHGNQPTLADVFLVPQMFNAQRIGCPLDALPTVRRITDACLQLPAFADAQPLACPDAA